MKTTTSRVSLALSLLFFLASCAKDDSNFLSHLQQNSAQKKYSFGVIPVSRDIYEAIPEVSGISIGGKVSVPPSSYIMAMPQVGDQGSEASCVAFAVGYAARSAIQYYNDSTNYHNSTNVFSPAYIYNQIKVSDCGSGSYMTNALNLLVNQGVCRYDMMPYNTAQGCSVMPNTSQTADASNFKINGYARVPLASNTTIKRLVANDKPVVFSFSVFDNFIGLAPGQIYAARSNTYLGAHAMIICGYDNSKHAYRVMNSWGSGWADGGYTWIDYDVFPQIAFEAYVMK